MFQLLKGWASTGEDNGALMRFYEELKKNLEIYFVMDQRQFIDMEFKTTQWQKIHAGKTMMGLEKIHAYGRAIEDFNKFYREFKDYEKWYATADLANKTKDNAQKLHTQRSELDGQLKDLYKIICAAGEQLEYRLIALGLIKQ